MDAVDKFFLLQPNPCTRRDFVCWGYADDCTVNTTNWVVRFAAVACDVIVVVNVVVFAAVANETENDDAIMQFGVLDDTEDFTHFVSSHLLHRGFAAE
jgi:hypothetical protein